MRISAKEIYKITRSDLLYAIDEFSEDKSFSGFKDSTGFDILIDGHKRLPPKIIIGIAAKKALGETWKGKSFTGGESSTIFRLFKKNGFEVVTKLQTVGSLDATFSVGMSSEKTFLIVESRGPERNTEYFEGMISILNSLQKLDAEIKDIYLDTASTRSLPVEDRRLVLQNLTYPFYLNSITDIESLRLEITRAAGLTGTSRDKAKGGNPTKRLRFILGLDKKLNLRKISNAIGEANFIRTNKKKKFTFTPQSPVGTLEYTERKHLEPTIITHLHNELQKFLYDELVLSYGKESVSAEQISSSGRPADLVVKDGDQFKIFEIKTSSSPRDCIRQALGQILEYSYWPGSPNYSELWIVGPKPLDEESSQYLDTLTERFSLPLKYRCVVTK
jgi:hypothetical protein